MPAAKRYRLATTSPKIHPIAALPSAIAFPLKATAVGTSGQGTSSAKTARNYISPR
ncbi:hypothetical protein [Scytonema sp. PCC 10023]|uniref:hypothetical protein n=1 Tax=Scytonema sp. PCC 10023 TaxID=1680591 RepID=UPI0039C61D6C